MNYPTGFLFLTFLQRLKCWLSTIGGNLDSRVSGSKMGFHEEQRFLSGDDQTDDGSQETSRTISNPVFSLKAKVAALLLFLAVSTLVITNIALVTECSPRKAVSTTIGAKSTTQTDLKPKYMMEAPCGSTAAEARQRGCKFDIISFGWFPEQCYDAELSDAFDGITTWEWFQDPNKTQPLSHEQIMTGEFTGLYVNWEYHVRHCTAMWKKMHRAILGKGKAAIDSYIGELPHTEHCSHMLLDRDAGFGDINTIILVKFPDCGIM